MSDLKAEIIKYLKDEAGEKVKGSEFSPDEHFFGIASEMLEESIPVSKIQELFDGSHSDESASIYDNYDELINGLEQLIKGE